MWLWLMLVVLVAASSCTRCCTTVLSGVLSGFDGFYVDPWVRVDLVGELFALATDRWFRSTMHLKHQKYALRLVNVTYQPITRKHKDILW